MTDLHESALHVSARTDHVPASRSGPESPKMSSPHTTERHPHMQPMDLAPVHPAAEYLARLIEEEVHLLIEVLPDALERQWEPSPAPRPRFDTDERATGDRVDPTGDTVTDPRRLAVRQTVKDAEALLRETAIRVRGVRRAMELSVAWYDRAAE